MPTTSTRSPPTAASPRAIRTGRSACSTRSCKKGYDYGLSKIYEMVINNDPCYAYLMRCNHTVDQKLVMAHVYGHCDFFKNNAYFGHTNRKMMDEMANHGVAHPPLRREVRRGRGRGLHRPLHVDRRPDRHPLRRPSSAATNESVTISSRGEDEEDERKPTRFKSKDYMDDYINPPASAEGSEEDEERKQLKDRVQHFPERPEKDVLLFLIEHAPLKDWQRDVLSHRPRRGLLLLPAGADQDHQRRLGLASGIRRS